MGIVRHKQNARLGTRPCKSATTCGNILLSASPRAYGAVAGAKADRTDKLLVIGGKCYLGVPEQPYEGNCNQLGKEMTKRRGRRQTGSACIGCKTVFRRFADLDGVWNIASWVWFAYFDIGGRKSFQARHRPVAWFELEEVHEPWADSFLEVESQIQREKLSSKL
jgi:hypothetical protein